MKEIPILILHGWRVPIERYLPLKNLFIKAGFKVFIPQLPGFSNGKILSKTHALDDYVQFVIDFAEKNKLDRFFLIGHSFGGRVAIKLTASYPEKVKALVLTGVPAIRDKDIKKLLFLILAKIGKVVCTIPPFCLLERKAKKLLYHSAGEWDYYETKGLMRETFKKIISEDLEHLLPKIKAPSLLLWGEKDKIVPVSIAQQMVNKIPRAKLTVISNVSHKFPYEQPKTFSEKCLKFFLRFCRTTVLC